MAGHSRRSGASGFLKRAPFRIQDLVRVVGIPSPPARFIMNQRTSLSVGTPFLTNEYSALYNSPAISQSKPVSSATS